MLTFFIRRLLGTAATIVGVAVVCYGLIQVAPGGTPIMLGDVRCDPCILTLEDIDQIRQYYGLDFYSWSRFTRWLIGEPRGPLLGSLFPDLAVGCSKEKQVAAQIIRTYLDGREERELTTIVVGCLDTLTLAELKSRSVTRGFLFGDFGKSWGILRDRPVWMVIESRLRPTLILTISALLLSIGLGTWLAVYTLRNQPYFWGPILEFGFRLQASLPVFWFSILMTLVFAVWWDVLPPNSMRAPRDYGLLIFGTVAHDSAQDYVLHFVMPLSVLTFYGTLRWAQTARASVLTELQQAHIQAARARGLSAESVFEKHALRNVLGLWARETMLELPNLLLGALVVEVIFNWPGAGRLFVDALNRSDYPVALALLYMGSVGVVVARLLSEVSSKLFDPRQRLPV